MKARFFPNPPPSNPGPFIYDVVGTPRRAGLPTLKYRGSGTPAPDGMVRAAPPAFVCPCASRFFS